MNCSADMMGSLRWCICTGLFALLCLLLTTADCCGQESSDAGKDFLNRKNFPWYESETDTVVDLDRVDPGHAKTLERSKVSGYTPKQTQNANGANNWSAGWITSLFSSTVWVIIAVVFLAIIAILVWVFLQMENRQGSSTFMDEDEVEKMQERIKQLPFQLAQANDSGDFRDLAQQAAQRGDFSRATMLLFSHVLIQLDKNGLIELKRGKTNRQYLRELKPHHGLVQYYQRVMVPFEDSFFGDHDVARQVYESCWADLDGFQNEVSECSEAVVV